MQFGQEFGAVHFYSQPT